MKTITIQVNDQAATVYENAAEENRRKFDLLLSLKLREAALKARPLEEIMSEISRNARQRGMSPEILDAIL